MNILEIRPFTTRAPKRFATGLVAAVREERLTRKSRDALVRCERSSSASDSVRVAGLEHVGFYDKTPLETYVAFVGGRAGDAVHLRAVVNRSAVPGL